MKIRDIYKKNERKMMFIFFYCFIFYFSQIQIECALFGIFFVVVSFVFIHHQIIQDDDILIHAQIERGLTIFFYLQFYQWSFNDARFFLFVYLFAIKHKNCKKKMKFHSVQIHDEF